MERLQKIIANRGYCSRRKAEELITMGKVVVNGAVIRELGVKVDEKDSIVIDGEVVRPNGKEYYLLYKPRGVVTTVHDDKNRKTVVDLVASKTRIYPIGRLDYDTTGVLLLTSDGEFANELMHPKSGIDKTYIAKIKGILSGEAIHYLKHGVIIDGRKTSPARVKVRKQNKKEGISFVELTIHEGRNHQVKKMFECLGYEVLKLKRERIEFLDLKGLKSGEYRRLTPKEVSKLHELCQRNLVVQKKRRK